MQDSVTKFGEILRLWQNQEIFGNILKVYLVFGKVVSHFGTISFIWSNILCCKWPNIEKNNLTIWSH